MRQITALSIIFGISLLLSCGGLEGNFPDGVSGGIENVYLDERLLGRWAYYTPFFETRNLTFYSDGACNFSIEGEGPSFSADGAWMADGKSYRFEIDRFYPRSGYYTVTTDELNLISGDATFHYFKVPR